MEKKALNVNEIAYLLAHKPLVIVRLQHSETNKRLIGRALRQVWQSPGGPETVRVLREFLDRVTPKYNLNSDQRGVRDFLLREIEGLNKSNRQKSGGFWSSLSGAIQFG
jgi:hypothetical protein